MYSTGRGVARSDARAVTLFENACAKGTGAACSGLGSMVEQGRGIASDPRRAAGLFRQVCEEEQRTLGVIAPDCARAAELDSEACDAGVLDACRTLAVAYDDGSGKSARSRSGNSATSPKEQKR
jgi:hypothetical protein